MTPEQLALAHSRGYLPDLKYSDLQKVNASFDLERMKENEALFQGGKLFDEQLKKDKFLIKRESEKGSGSSANADEFLRYENPGSAGAAAGAVNGTAATTIGNTFALRKKYVSYKTRAGGLINFIIAGVLSSTPVIVATTQADQSEDGLADRLLGFFGIPKNPQSDDKVQFYHDLNSDCDGLGNSLTQYQRKLLRDLAVHGRAFAGVTFPQPNAGNALEHREAGGNDGMSTHLPAMECDDWDFDDDGLCMLRRHFFTMTRSNPALPPDQKRETWSYITRYGIFSYAIDWKKSTDGTPPTQPGAEDRVPLVSAMPNTLKSSDDEGLEMPVRMIDFGMHIMEILRPSIIDQINIRCDHRWAIARDVYALAYFCTKRGLTNVDPSTMAIQMDPGDSAGILSPNPGILAPIVEALDRNDDDMYESMMALILKSAAQASNGRQSGEAKRMDYNTFETFLLVFSEPLRAVIKWQVETIRRQRGDTGIIATVQGLDNFDIESVGQILQDAKEFLALQGVPDIGRKSIILKAYRAAMGSAATPEQLEQFVKEIGVAPLPAPIEPKPPGGPGP